MAKDRLALHEKLLATLGSTQVYYNTPPSTVKLEYPCIIYKLDDVAGVSANNKKYWGTRRYLITIVDKKPDPKVVDTILSWEYSKFEDPFIANNLYHYVLSLHW